MQARVRRREQYRGRYQEQNVKWGKGADLFVEFSVRRLEEVPETTESRVALTQGFHGLLGERVRETSIGVYSFDDGHRSTQKQRHTLSKTCIGALSGKKTVSKRRTIKTPMNACICVGKCICPLLSDHNCKREQFRTSVHKKNI